MSSRAATPAGHTAILLEVVYVDASGLAYGAPVQQQQGRELTALIADAVKQLR